MLLLLLACDGGDSGKVEDTDTGVTDTADTSDTDTSVTETDTSVEVVLDGECPQETKYGNFTVDSNVDYGYVAGSALNGVVPITVLTPTLTEGDCTIFKRENPFCDPSCESGFTCNLDNECVPYPEQQDLGTVTVSGLLDAVSMEPNTPGYTYFDTSVPNPPWAPGAIITLETTGGAFAPVTLQGVGVDVFTVADLDWQVAAGEALRVSWDPPTIELRSEVRLTLNIDQHGITPSTAVCIFADDGEGEVPASIIDNLFNLGVSGFPNGTLTRRSVDSAPLGDGCMDFAITASNIAQIDVAGFTPCTSDDDCPEGQECNLAIQLCE